MKKVVRLTESDLHRIVNRSVKNILRESKVRQSRRRMIKEGHSDGVWYERWEKLIDMLGADGMLNWLWNCLDSNEIEADIRWIAQQEDIEGELGLNDEDEDEEDEEMEDGYNPEFY
jgi:hypothetical protein